MINSYPSPQQIGSRSVRNLFDGPVVVQEKVDGSQISFGLDHEGNLRVRSRGAELNLSSPDKMFAQAIVKLQSVKDSIRSGHVYRGEYLAKPKHNVLCYDRVPFGNIALFDISNEAGDHATPSELLSHAMALGMDSVPVIFEGVTSASDLRPFLDRTSFLGGAMIEGVVVKNYALAKTQEHFAGKFVSEAFKETHGDPVPNKSAKDDRTVTDQIISSFGTKARWQKALQHLREAGQIQDSPKDIGLLVKEVQSDIEKECAEEIKERLWQAHQAALKTGFINGLALWYKDTLLALSHEQP